LYDPSKLSAADLVGGGGGPPRGASEADPEDLGAERSLGIVLGGAERDAPFFGGGGGGGPFVAKAGITIARQSKRPINFLFIF